MEVSVMRCAWAALCVAVLGMSGSAEGASLAAVKTTNPDQLFLYGLTMDISNRIFNASLLIPTSRDYKILKEEVSSALYSVYGCSTCDTKSFYQGVKDMSFSNKDGSVLVMVTIVFKSSQTNTVIIKELFKRALADGNEINGLKVNPNIPIVVSGPHHNAASPSFHQSLITTFLRYSLSFGLLYLLGYSF